ncbi:MAG: hypothetical protein WCX28_15165, partial [Bacteriovoracaceae bacterium]
YASRRNEITTFLKNGGQMVLIEPEFRVVGSVVQHIAEGLDLKITHRTDVDKGGYDSYVFTEDQNHPLWKKLGGKHLKLFNGAIGGEIVSQYDVDFSLPSQRLASCGIDLNVVAASEIEYGSGKVLLFRLQLRGRLNESETGKSLFARRKDPVARQLLMNMLEYCDAV